MDRKPHLREPFRLGDIVDLEAYVYRIVSALPEPVSQPDEVEELVLEGIARAFERHAELASGQSLQRELSGWLRWRLQDHWRTLHPELRRNSRAGTSYFLGTPTGLSSEHEGDAIALPARDEQDLIHSRLALASITNASQLRDPHVTGRFASGVPSYGALATGRSQDVYASILEERQAHETPPFHVLLDPTEIV